MAADGQVPSWSLVTSALARLEHPGKSVVLQKKMDGFESHFEQYPVFVCSGCG